MPSLPRYSIIDDNSTFHVTWQCHNKDWLMEEDWVKETYYNLLLKYKERYKVTIYSYCFMSNHIHLSGKLNDKEEFSSFFRIVNSLFARVVNKTKSRRGQVVMDRFKSPRIESDASLLRVMTYIDLNPKRAGMVVHPRDNKFSSYNYYAYGKEDILITPAPSYIDLGKTDDERQRLYRELVESILKNDWKDKKPYSSMLFIGDPDWVVDRMENLRIECKKRYTKWKEKFKEKYKT
jgi:putative transposase